MAHSHIDYNWTEHSTQYTGTVKQEKRQRVLSTTRTFDRSFNVIQYVQNY